MDAVMVFGDLDMATLAERLRLARRTAGMTQAQVSLYAALHPTHYNEIEKGKLLNLRANTLYKLCQALQVSADYLLGLDTRPRRDLPLMMQHDHVLCEAWSLHPQYYCGVPGHYRLLPAQED